AAAQKMIRDRLSITALVAAESLPYIMETGQSQIINLANDNLLGIQPGKLQPVLSELLRALPFFRQLSFFNARGELVAAYPITRLDEMRLSPQELAGIHQAEKGVELQTYTLDAWPGENSAQISFMAAVMNAKGKIEGVLVGRTDLSSNPFIQPAIQSLETMKAIGGEGMILDENDRILYHSQPALVMASYLGDLSDQEEFFDETTPAGKRRLVFHRPTIGRPWSVVLTVPAEYVQQLTLTIAMPMLLLLPLLSLLAVVSLRLGLRSVTSSLNKLANEVTLIAQGDLDQPVRVEGEDEVGRFGKAFEQMRISLKARLEEINRLLLVSQGVAAHLKLEDAVRPVLEAALGDSSALARLVLGGELRVEPSRDSLVVLGLGPASDEWAYLDPQIFELARQQNIVVIPNMQRLRQLNIPAGSPTPGSLLAQAICHENTYYGVLWVGYTEPRSFSEEERRYLTTLASQAALAVINARLYATQEIGRQRLESVLSSSPDPVLVIDEQLCINLINPAALQAPGLIASACLGKPVRDVIQNPDLLALLATAGDKKTTSREITTPHGMVYNASVSPVVVDGKSAGTVCILQDITHYKALDVLKSDFISTVSQGLRAPLAQLRGSAAMLERVGDLNEPQKNYVEKILSGIERMNELVSNLLDQGRIDGRGGLIIESVSTLDIVGQVMDSLAPQASQKKITLHKIGVSEDGDASSCEIQADRVLLEQALFNLVENAIKYSRSGGEVVVKCEPRDDQFVFEVKDKGAGIAPLDVENIFEKPSRNARRGAGKPGVTGISLAMVKSIAERHGGRVWAESVLGKGSSFYMEIPIHQSAD
ncbi:MAG: ATP-binding protein, partial [Anaerolineaceae bacterium]|nr:ATP-binding protein [Anaerolineaceae bacterium]